MYEIQRSETQYGMSAVAAPASRGSIRIRFWRGWLDLRTFSFASFLSAGAFKAAPHLAWLPVDLTVFFFGLCLLFAAFDIACVISGRKQLATWDFQRTIPFILMASLFGAFLIPLAITEWDDYAFEKVSRLFTLTLCAAFLPLILIKTREDLQRFFNALMLLGLLMAADAVVSLATGQGLSRGGDRVSVMGAHPILLGRAAGVAAIWIAIRWLEGRTHLLFSLPVFGVLLVGMFVSGSRGPLLSFIGAIAITAVLFYVGRIRSTFRLGMVILVAALFLVFGSSVATDRTTERIERILSGDTSGSSETARKRVYSLCMETIVERPFGVGWGGFNHLGTILSDRARQRLMYPHNVIFETLLEGGWYSGIFFLGLLGWGIWRVGNVGLRKRSMETRGLFALVLFTFFNALVSADLNGNRALFALMMLALAILPPGKNEPGTGHREMPQSFYR